MVQSVDLSFDFARVFAAKPIPPLPDARQGFGEPWPEGWELLWTEPEWDEDARTSLFMCSELGCEFYLTSSGVAHATPAYDELLRPDGTLKMPPTELFNPIRPYLSIGIEGLVKAEGLLEGQRGKVIARVFAHRLDPETLRPRTRRIRRPASLPGLEGLLLSTPGIEERLGAANYPREMADPLTKVTVFLSDNAQSAPSLSNG